MSYKREILANLFWDRLCQLNHVLANDVCKDLQEYPICLSREIVRLEKEIAEINHKSKQEVLNQLTFDELVDLMRRFVREEA